MTDLPVICILTSAMCGHCNKMRNTGALNTNASCIPTIPGGYCWNESFFKNLICNGTDTPKVRVFEIHFGIMNFEVNKMYEKIIEFSEFIWTGTKVQRNKYRSEYVRSLEAK